jgi:molybdate-binding protein
MIPHDGTYRGTVPEKRGEADPRKTLVLASCDPAVGLLAAALAATSGIRLIVLGRSSRDALGLLRSGLVHAAGVHLSQSGEHSGNTAAVRESVGAGFTLLRVARWEEGIAAAPTRKLASVGAAVESNLRWVGREAGSGARQCLDQLLEGRRPPRHSAADHRGVAEAIRSGWADVGVCLRVAAADAGLDFLSVREEAYDLCFPDQWKDDPRLEALVEVVRSTSYRSVLADLPGYNSRDTGDLLQVG